MLKYLGARVSTLREIEDCTMKNYLLGIATELAGAVLYTVAPHLVWQYWAMFVAGCVLIVFNVDVFFGSLAEQQPRAVWMGIGMFGGSGVVL